MSDRNHIIFVIIWAIVFVAILAGLFAIPMVETLKFTAITLAAYYNIQKWY